MSERRPRTSRFQPPRINRRRQRRALGQASSAKSSLPAVGGLDLHAPGDALFIEARRRGLPAIGPIERLGLNRITGDIAEAVATLFLTEGGFNVFWQITKQGITGVDLLLLTPSDRVIALEVKGTLRSGAIPRLTPSRFRQMSRDWLNRPDNPGMIDWTLEADDLFAGVMVVDFADTRIRLALSGDYERYLPVDDLAAVDVLLEGL